VTPSPLPMIPQPAERSSVDAEIAQREGSGPDGRKQLCVAELLTYRGQRDLGLLVGDSLFGGPRALGPKFR